MERSFERMITGRSIFLCSWERKQKEVGRGRKSKTLTVATVPQVSTARPQKGWALTCLLAWFPPNMPLIVWDTVLCFCVQGHTVFFKHWSWGPWCWVLYSQQMSQTSEHRDMQRRLPSPQTRSWPQLHALTAA